MRNPIKKRAPQGATSLIVLDAICRLYDKGGRRAMVSRADLLRAIRLPETTVDDRLRTLVKEGRVLRAGRALYVPKSWLCVEPHRSESTRATRHEPRRSELPGTIKTTYLPDGMIVEEKWFRRREM